MAERQVLLYAINIRWSDEHRLAQRTATLGTFALKQVASSCAAAHDLAASGYFEAFGY